MSRIGRLPVAIPAGVTVEVAENNVVTVKGPKGTLTRELPTEMEIKVEGEEVTVTRPNDLKKMKSLHGLTRTLINNMVVGVTEGYQKVLEVNGVGYRASKSGNKLTLNLGYSHPVEMIDPEGVETVLEGQNKITFCDISLIKKNICDSKFHLGCRYINCIMFCSVRITDSCKHICNRIAHSHVDVSSFYILSVLHFLPRGKFLCDAPNCFRLTSWLS